MVERWSRYPKYSIDTDSRMAYRLVRSLGMRSGILLASGENRARLLFAYLLVIIDESMKRQIFYGLHTCYAHVLFLILQHKPNNNNMAVL